MIQHLEWDEKYSMGIAVFDEQHQRIIQLLNKLLDAAKDNKKTEEFGIVLKELISYAASHFTAEEDAMKKYDYPHYKEYRDEHDEIKLKLSELYQKYVEDDMPNTIELLKFITHWIDNHLKNADMNYAPFLIKKGFK